MKSLMQKFTDMVTALVSSQEEKPEQDLPSPPSVLDVDTARQYYNALVLLVPTEALQMTAYDDYYPSFYYALRRFENVRSGLSMEQEPQEGGLIDRFYKLQQDLRAALPEYDEQGQEIKPYKESEFLAVLHAHADLLVAMKAALNTPIENIPEIAGLNFADPSQPLKADLAFNTRFGKEMHTTVLEEFLNFLGDIERANHKKLAPDHKGLFENDAEKQIHKPAARLDGP